MLRFFVAVAVGLAASSLNEFVVYLLVNRLDSSIMAVAWLLPLPILWAGTWLSHSIWRTKFSWTRTVEVAVGQGIGMAIVPIVMGIIHFSDDNLAWMVFLAILVPQWLIAEAVSTSFTLILQKSSG